MPTVLAILAEGFEEIEAVAPIDLLRRAGAEVTVAALSESIHVTGRSSIILHADTTLAAVSGTLYDCVFLPGGPGVKQMRADLRIAPMLQRHAEEGRWIAAICAAPTVLLGAGLLEGRQYTAHFSVANELPALLTTEKVVVDGKLITSQGAGTALEFGLVLIEKLFSPERSAEIGRSICK